MVQKNHARRCLRSDGFTLIEILIVAGVISVLAAIAVPGLLRARRASLESAAIASLRTVNSAEATYSAACARGGYAQSLDDLSKPAPGSAQLFISPDIPGNGVVKSGYEFNVGPDTSAMTVLAGASTCNTATLDAVSGYFGEAHPSGAQAAGQRSFATDTRGIIFYQFGGAVIAPGMNGAVPLH